MRSDDLYKLPPDLPVPADDGSAQHLLGELVPTVYLQSTYGDAVNLSTLKNDYVVVYCYPRTGRPNVEALGGTKNWNAIPGARGCTPQSCSYRDLHGELADLGAKVYGLSTQTTEYQTEAARRLQLPFPLLSDSNFKFSDALELPQFEVEGIRLIKRITLIIRNGYIVHYFYPVYPPEGDANNVTEWIRDKMKS